MQDIRFEAGQFAHSMSERLQAALDRIEALDNYQNIEGSSRQLREEQIDVFTDFVDYLREALDREFPFARIILPPRTGKTVIIGQIIRACQLTALVLVPTKTLAEQAKTDLEKQLPGVHVALYYGDSKELTGNGINVMTYQIFVQMWKNGTLPKVVTRSALIMADEAHHTMTEDRMNALRDAFDPQAIRVACTASPDYEERRQLAHYFPDLIHKITIPEAVQMGLLAKMKAHVHEVDVDASQVRIVGNDFADEQLGELMSSLPFFELARKIRYDDPRNRERSTLISCRSREQAYNVCRYLTAFRPEGTSQPAIILGETNSDQRRDALRDFDDGIIDTLIQVGVLVEGWNSPRCKLLIDLSPTMSLVRATQKFFRPLTKWEAAEAGIHLILPKNLLGKPILPQEIIFEEAPNDELPIPRDFVEKKTRKPNELAACTPNDISPVEEVSVESRVILTTTLHRPLLDKHSPDEIRDVLESWPAFDPTNPPRFQDLRHHFFDHALYKGRGLQLLRHLGLSIRAEVYRALLCRLYLDQVPTDYLRDHHERASTVSCAEDVRVLERLFTRLPTKVLRDRGVDSAWRTLTGPDPLDELSPDDRLDKQNALEHIQRTLEELLPRNRELLLKHFGFHQDENGETREWTYEELATSANLSRERVRQIINRVLDQLRMMLRYFGRD